MSNIRCIFEYGSCILTLVSSTNWKLRFQGEEYQPYRESQRSQNYGYGNKDALNDRKVVIEWSYIDYFYFID